MTTNQSTVKDQIAALENELLNAFTTNNPDTLIRLIHESALFVLPNGLTVTKAMVLDNYRTGGTSMSSIRATDQIISITEGTAVVSVNLEMAGKYKDQLISQQFRYIRVWKLFGGEWQVIAVSGVPLGNK